jgi:CPA1 family monovalent cation:H+ antiporter
MHTLGQLDVFLNIIVIVTIISLITRRLRIPSAVVLIIAGLISTFLSPESLSDLGPDIFTILLLPPIIFQETFHTDVNKLIDDSYNILTYAILGTVLTIILVAIFVSKVLGFTIIESLLLGIIIAPTDPVAVIYAFNQLGVVKRFQLIVSGESLFNDGVAISLYSIVLSFLTLGSLNILDIINIGSMTILGGIIIGILGGYICHTAFYFTDEKFAEVLLSLILVIGVFRVSESIGASGVIATVVSSLIINYRIRYYGGVGKESMEMLDIMWEFIGFIASSIAFIFIGVNLEPSTLLSSLIPVTILFLFLLLARYLVVHGVTKLLEQIHHKCIPLNWRHGLFWSGLRGAVSIVLVQGLSRIVLPNSNTMLALTFGIVLVSNLLHGPTIPFVVKRLDIFSTFETAVDLDEEAIVKTLYSDDYNNEGYDFNRSIFEKIFFSAPEYLVKDTSFGARLEMQLRTRWGEIKQQISELRNKFNKMKGY